jgi:hypothetical protein
MNPYKRNFSQLTQNSNIAIKSSGKYIPAELGSMCNDEDEPRLQLLIQSQSKQVNKQFDSMLLFITNNRV